MKTPPVNLANFHAERKQIEESLKPCPFCGNTEIEFSLYHPQFNGHPDMDYWCYWGILCPNCGAEMENGRMDNQSWEDAKAEIIAAWNRRTPPDSLPA